MLARVSKRTLPQEIYRQSVYCLEGLQLPFLCPTLYKQPLFSRNTSSIIQVRSRKKSHRASPSAISQTLSDRPTQNRSLASAATTEHTSQNDAFVPWGQPLPGDNSYQQVFNGQGISTIPTFNPNTSPIIINDSLITHPRTFRRAKEAVGGDLNEIHQTLHACLQVGRFDRAATLVRRLNEVYKPDAPGLLTAHNDYITELSHRIVQHGDHDLLKRLQAWFQVDMLNAGVEPDETTFAMMIRASLRAPKSNKDRTVRRYLNLAKEAGITEETKAIVSSYEAVDLNSPSFDGSLNDPTPSPDAEVDQPKAEADAIRQMEQKGLGLSTLKKSLSIFSDTGRDVLDEKVGSSPAERQRLLEINTADAAMDRWREEDAHLKSIGVNSSLSTSSIGALMWSWHEKLVPLIVDSISKSQEAEQKEEKDEADEERLLWGPYLQTLPPEKISAITILATLKICSTETMDERGVRIHNLVQGIGNAIQDESIAEGIRKESKYGRIHERLMRIDARSKVESTRKIIRTSKTDQYDKFIWAASSKVKLGALLLSHLMDIAKLSVSKEDPRKGLQVRELQPVLFHTYQYILGKRVGVVRLNPTMMERLSQTPVVSALAKYLPMVCEPKPWTGYCEGGFLEYPLPVIRLSSSDSQAKRYCITAAENGDMAQVFAGLDVLAKTSWNINRFVFDVMLEAWNTGQAIADIPSEIPTDDTPPKPSTSQSFAERYKWMKQVREFENQRSGLKSQRCFQNFQLEVARAYLNETFYFPHNCDFRGRAYPMAPFLNHMGADNVRGLLMFAEGKELTSEGLRWLKIHLANVYGFDKASFTERVAFADDHISEIRDSVNKPLSGEKWWLKAEDPWQCLAACKELKSALDLSDPTKYVSKLAIHQDGTCNGLQHYAALGGDVAGAQQVNLEPGSRPSDIYTAVAELVKADIARDASQGRGRGLAKVLDGKITRKVVKQTVMTNVYGVTFTGAKRQVRKQLDDLLVDFPATREVNLDTAASYIAKKIFAALATMFNGAHDIQHWLTACAGRISESLSSEQVAHVGRSIDGEYFPSQFKKLPLRARYGKVQEFKTTVIWTTPLKMPVVQPYRKKTPRRIDTNLQKITIMNRSAADPVDKTKQLQAFPPNFIHSLDATHMFLTALKCNEVGLTFAAIHDSFWTHAGDVHSMNRVIRDAFIRMHSEDIIGRLAAEFAARYKGYMHLASVRIDTRIGQKIMAWRRETQKRFESAESVSRKRKGLEARKWDELILERRRLDLLASQDPKERERGQQMETPGMIFSQAADEESLAPVDFKPPTIGFGQSSRDSRLKANQQLDVGDMHNAEPIASEAGNDIATKREVGMDDLDDTHLVDKTENDALVDENEEGEPSGTTEAKAKVKKYKAVRKTWGDFDVTRLKDSQYFFS